MKADVHLDHLAHWVPDIATAAAALERMGFTTTPYAEHRHSPAPELPTVPAGSGNQCVMLREGYLEVLAVTADTPIAREVRAALARYTGVHLTALAVSDAGGERERLVAAGFPQRPTVRLERPTVAEDGAAATARFTVVRPQTGCLAEGRVQFLTHHTPELLWQSRWMSHDNTAVGLGDVLFCVHDPEEAMARYQRYLDRAARAVDGGYVLAFERGRLALLTPERLAETMPDAPLPEPPCMAGYAVTCADAHAVRSLLDARGLAYHDSDDAALWLAAPPALGGIVAFMAVGASPPWLGGRAQRGR